MHCYACGEEAVQQCPRCGRWCCQAHGGEQCNQCRAPASVPPPAHLFHLATALLVISIALTMWHLVAWPEFPTLRLTAEARETGQQSTVATTAGSAEAESTPAPSPTPERRRYKVAEGDTLSGIAAQFDRTAEAIAQANNLADPEALQIGQELVIP